jgi:hypothetical protein
MTKKRQTSFRSADRPRPTISVETTRRNEASISYDPENSDGILIQSRNIDDDNWIDAYSDVNRNPPSSDGTDKTSITDTLIGVRHPGAVTISYRAKYVYKRGTSGDWSDEVPVTLLTE